MIQNWKFIAWILFFCLTKPLSAAIILEGDAKDDQTFSFPIKAYASNLDGSVGYVGARTASGKDYALSMIVRGKSKCKPAAPENVNINMSESKTKNPLFDAAIRFITLMYAKEQLVIIPDDKPYSAYSLDKITNPEKIVLLPVSSIKDANNEQTNGVIALTAEPMQFSFAAVKNNNGDDFGTAGSGIAVLYRGQVIDESKEQPTANQFFIQLDAQPGPPPVPNATRAAELTGATPAVYINNPAIIKDNVALHVNNGVRILYIGLQAQAADTDDDGARALLMAGLINNKLIYFPIAPDDAFTAQHIIGARGANEIVSCYKIESLFTSTALDYLVILGGCGDPDYAKKTVYALPIVNALGTTGHGMLANKNNLVPVDQFEKEAPFRFAYRAFTDPAQQAGDLFIGNEPAVQVGGSPIQAGEIIDIFVKSDAVFAMVKDDNYPGIYYSRALFDEHGVIKAWTPWQRAIGTTNDHIFGAYTDDATAECTFLVGSDENDIRIVKQTIWGGGDANGLLELTKFLSEQFPKKLGGISQVIDFSTNTPGFDNIALSVAAGINTITMAQTAQVNAQTIPLVGTNIARNPRSFSNGTIAENFPVDSTNAIAISGGVLNQIGPLVTATIGHNPTSNHWLFAGGVNGLAILADENGNGWATLGNNLAGLTDGMTFKQIGDYQFIRKLVCDNRFLYVLTDKKLDRIDLAVSDFSNGLLEVTTIVQHAEFNATSLHDAIIVEDFILLATSNGLYYTGANGISEHRWMRLTLPEGSCCVTQLYAISPTGRIADITNDIGGNIYVLDAEQGKNRAYVHRFAIKSVNGAITLSQIPDLFIKNHPSYLIKFDGFRNWIVPDGDFLFHASDQNLCVPPTIQVAPSNLHSGSRFTGNSNAIILMPRTQYAFEHFGIMIRNSSTGSWLLPGDFGILCNE